MRELQQSTYLTADRSDSIINVTLYSSWSGYPSDAGLWVF